ncbi:MAG: GDP-mannose 4,6-dehydratase, partial [Bacteroidota bacterium]
DLSDPGLITDLIYNIKPDEIYHLGAQSHVRVSFDLPEYTGDITALGTLRILEAVRRSGVKCRFYQASSSEMFGAAPPPQSELTPFAPQSPYAIAKVYAYWITRNYRDAYKLFATNGILFNHESPRRGEIFVTRKITRALANILAGRQAKLYLGNLDAKRDWGFAPEYVEAMWKVLQHESPEDFVIGTGHSYSVREFLEKAASYVGLQLQWSGSGPDEKGRVASRQGSFVSEVSEGATLVEIDPKYYRPTEVDFLQADISKAKNLLGWEPKVTFDELVKVMMDYDLLAAGLTPPGEGIKSIEAKGFTWTKHKFSVHEAIKEGLG